MNITQRPFLKREFHKYKYAVVDTTTSSPNYFDIVYCPETIGGGKSFIKLKGNGQNLVRKSEVEIEVLDVAGNALRTEITTFIDRFSNYFATISVYDNTIQGVGRVNIVGVANKDLAGNVLDDRSHNDLGYNVFWTKPINILPFERNNSDLIMDKAPTVYVDQVLAPLRVNSLQTIDQQFTAITSSDATIVTSPFKGFDKKDSNSKSVTDLRLQNIRINPNQDSITTNAVNTATRRTHKDIEGGFLVNETNQYNTVITTNASFFSSSHVGGYVEFFNTNYTLLPQTQSNATLANTNPYNTNITQTTQSVDLQLASWRANVVKVLNSKTAYIDQPVQINVQQTTANRGTSTTTHTYNQVTNFTASLLYTPNSETYLTSSTVSQSYLQFTFNDLKPLAGSVYKIRAFYKRSSVNQDWTLLNDQIIKSPQYLVDARYPNQTSYARSVSDYLLQGYFTSQQIVDGNWNVYNDTTAGFDTATASYVSTPLIDSLNITTATNYNKIATTKYYQNYAENQIFTLDFNCVLAPNTELELYMSSDALTTTLIDITYQSRAFNRTKNLEKDRYSDNYNRFGKYIGKVINNSTQTVSYGKIAFDFNTDADGLGRPIFRCSSTSTTNTGSAWISEVGIQPRELNGFTPEIVQFTIPTPLDFTGFLSESVDYKLEYFDYTGNQSEYVTYINSVPLNLTTTIPTNGCQSENMASLLGSATTYPGKFTPYLWRVCNTTSSKVAIGGANFLYSSQISSYASASNHKFYPHFEYEVNPAYGTTQILPYLGWNVLKPTMSISTGQTGDYTSSFRFTPNWTTDGADIAAGTITSSWHAIDPFILNYINNNVTDSTYSSSLYNQAFTQSAVTPIDNMSFYSASGVGITYLNVSNSYYSYSNAADNVARTEALKKRRLYWPTLRQYTSSYFTENGGIYNVRFRLKKYTGGAQAGSTYAGPYAKEYYPQTGSYMRVFIFDINKPFTAATVGTAGWYPPETNIVKIGHGYSTAGVTTPTLTWYDSATGYYYEEYDINVIQYGSPGQLVFEPSGDNSQFFGTIISDVQFCKVGVTQDPAFIKQQSVSNINIVVPTTQPYLPQR